MLLLIRIQLNVNKNGELGKILYICLQEITGNEFGPNIKLEVIIFYNKSIIIIKKKITHYYSGRKMHARISKS